MQIVRNEATEPQEFPSGEQHANLQAALARTATRSVALYFSRPVRLFRPSKVSGWDLLKGLAMQHGAPLTHQYIFSLVKNQGFTVIPKHFVPPMLINALLGTVLWTTYAEAHRTIEQRLGPYPTLSAALAGSAAGGMQALVAAPAENVRLVLEGGYRGNSWSNAWKEVFRGTSSASISRQASMEDVRQVRSWMKEVGDMAGRGWDGWGWGLGKDMCGFAAFFAVFEVTRRIASKAKLSVLDLSDMSSFEEYHSFKHKLPYVVHSATLITGGVVAGLAYETISRPWDIARRVVQLNRVTNPCRRPAATLVILSKIRESGVLSFFRYDPPRHEAAHGLSSGPIRRRIYTILRTLGRVGPWGVGFLVWEAYGHELS